MTANEQELLIETITESFDQLESTSDSLDGVKNIYEMAVDFINNTETNLQWEIEDADWEDAEGGEVITFVIPLQNEDEDNLDLAFIFRYQFENGKYQVFADVDFDLSTEYGLEDDEE